MPDDDYIDKVEESNKHLVDISSLLKLLVMQNAGINLNLMRVLSLQLPEASDALVKHAAHVTDITMNIIDDMDKADFNLDRMQRKCKELEDAMNGSFRQGRRRAIGFNGTREPATKGKSRKP